MMRPEFREACRNLALAGIGFTVVSTSHRVEAPPERPTQRPAGGSVEAESYHGDNHPALWGERATQVYKRRSKATGPPSKHPLLPQFAAARSAA